MDRKRILFAGVAAIAALAAGFAMAENKHQGHNRAGVQLEALFERADTNRDDRLTVAEMRADTVAQFSIFDTNRDGRITHEERQNHQANRMTRRFQRADKDQNGVLNIDELQAVAQIRTARRFVRLDMNQDGSVSLEEMAAAQQRQQAPRENVPSDGVATLATLDARMMNLFDQADTNRDGILTLDEARMAGRGLATK